MKRLFSTHVILSGVALAGLTGTACSTTTETNSNTAVVTSSPAAAASPSGGMSGMDHSGMDHSAMKSSPDAANAPYDLQFIDTMSAHHQGAIDMAMMAETKAQHQELKDFAAKIVADQRREIAQMKEWRSQWYAGRPEALNMEMPGMMDSMRGMDMNRLNAQTANVFDLMFIDMMIPHHQGAITMAREALQRAEHPEIKRIAEQIITAQEREIRQMNQWKAAWRQ